MFLAIIHVGGGSEVETAEPFSEVGPYETAREAEEAGNAVLNSVQHVDFLRNECFFTVVEIPNPPQDPSIAIAGLLEIHDDEDEAEDVVKIETITAQGLLR